RSVADEVGAGAIGGIAPDVAQVQEMADLVGRGASQVEGGGGAAGGPEGGIEYHDTIGLGGAAGELGVAQEALPEGADPGVEILLDVPGADAPRRLGFYGVAAIRE